MAHIAVSRRTRTDPDEVWRALADLRSHTEWMRDARSIDITSDSTRGVGTRMEVLTALGPFRTTDVMEVVRWEEGRLIEVRHEGLVRGQGTLGVRSDGAYSIVYWDETLDFPWRMGGPIAAWLAAPVLRFVWRGNLKRLERALSSP